MRSGFTICTLVLLFLLPFISKTLAAEVVFSTWDVFETDKCASIWLIKRFIDPKAEIRFFPHGTSITEGIPFDTPEAKFRRYATKSTFETLLEHYDIKDPWLKYIGRIIHDIEVNVWEKKVYGESTKVLEAIRLIIVKNEGNNEAIMEKSLQYFDAFYQSQECE
ncbi:MAG: chromate resistance protein [Desulfobulbaceae bacterium]|nr:chromate resistance protein [Desulfobulbaceae bacterium]